MNPAQKKCSKRQKVYPTHTKDMQDNGKQHKI